MSIYTKKGDKGQTSLYDGTRLPKSNIYFEVIGDIDELNSNIGLFYSFLYNEQKLLEKINIENIAEDFTGIQSNLFDISSFIATPPDASEEKLKRVSLDLKVEFLEQMIDELDQNMPKLKNFIMPRSQYTPASQLHVCRTICRRSERNIVKLIEAETRTDLDNVLIYMNRLSDFLFQTARYLNFLFSGKDEIYSKSNNSK